MAVQCRNVSLELLKCSTCREIPPNNVFQCLNGHPICDECYQYTKTCSQCSIELVQDRRIRSKVLEEILNLIEFDCPYKELGCQDKLIRRNNIPKHKETCSYRPLVVQLCKKIGIQCDYIVSSVGIPEAVQHLQEKHNFPLLFNTKEITIPLNSMPVVNMASSENAFWSPVLVKLENEKTSAVFLFLGAVTGDEDKLVQVLWWFFGDSSLMEEYQGEFQLSAKQSVSALKWNWMDRPTGIWTKNADPDLMSVASYKISLQFLVDNFHNQDSIIIKLFTTGSAIAELPKPETLTLEAEDNIALRFPRDYVCKNCKRNSLCHIFFASLMFEFYSICRRCINEEFLYLSGRDNIYAVVRTLRQEQILRKLISIDKSPVIKDRMKIKQPFRSNRDPSKRLMSCTVCKKTAINFPICEDLSCKGDCCTSVFSGTEVVFSDSESDSELEDSESEMETDGEALESDSSDEDCEGMSSRGRSLLPNVQQNVSQMVYTCLECMECYMCKKCALAGAHSETGHLLAIISKRNHFFYFLLDGGRNLKNLVTHIAETIDKKKI